MPTLTIKGVEDELVGFYASLGAERAKAALSIGKIACAFADEAVRVHSTDGLATLEEARVHHSAELERLKASLASRHERDLLAVREECGAEVEIREAHLNNARHELQRARAEISGIADSVRAANEADRQRLESQLAEVSSSNDALLASRAAFETHLKKAAAEDVERVEARLREERAVAERQIAHLTSLLESMQENMVKRMDSVLGGLSGSTRRGEIGEHLVRQVHESLCLGVFHNNSKSRIAGIADGTWTYDAPNSVKLQALVEVKYSQTPDSVKDIDKFREDVDTSVRAGRVNAALFLSLVHRIGGRPKIDLEIIHGVPVMWASRAANDELSALALVEMAFCAFASHWPLMHGAGAGAGAADDYLSKDMAHFMQSQETEFTRLERYISDAERSTEQLRRNASLLRKTRELLVCNHTNFQTRHPRVISHDDPVENLEEAEEAVRTAVLAYHQRKKGRGYPKSEEDLRGEVEEGVLASMKRHPDFLHSMVRAVKKQLLEAGAAKRQRGKVESAEDGAS